MQKKIKFEYKIVLISTLISFIPLILSYIIFINSRISYMNDNIKLNLKEISFIICQSELVKKKLYNRDNDYSIQKYTKNIISRFNDADIIVIGDMDEQKYSHLDETQIGKGYVGKDNERVLKYGQSYFSIENGSVGVTLRWFEPILYNNEQVGFVMVGKYYDDIAIMKRRIKELYIILFMLTLSISIVGSKIFSKKIKKEILGMEPYEIAMLYNQKKIIINSVKDCIIALDEYNKITDVNKNYYNLFEEVDLKEIIEKLRVYIDGKNLLEMKEFIIKGKKVFITMHPITQDKRYLGTIITLTDKKDISKLAKEITGVDEVIKDLRANIHEFRNNLHIILGLIQLKEYEQAKQYILNIQNIQKCKTNEVLNINDPYIKALLMSRELIARERQIEFKLDQSSILYKEHKLIDSFDLVTIIGNLIENAMDACSNFTNKKYIVSVNLYEDENKIEITVKDNGKSIDKSIKNDIFNEGVSSKGKNRGIGLSLVKNRVELYNGDIQIIENHNEKEFKITIPKGERNDKSINS